MAVPQVSKMITDRQRQCEFVDQFVVTHQPAVVEALVQLFTLDVEEGQASPDVVGFVNALVLRLRRAFADLVDTELRHLEELANDGVFRDLRDRAAQALREVLSDWRTLFRVAFGERKAEEVGFERRIAQQPLALLRQARRILTKLGDVAFELPAPRIDGVVVTREKAIEHLEEPVRQLRQAMDDLTRELSRAHGTQVAKDRALAYFDEVYGLFVRLLQSTFRLAEKPDLAERLPLRLSRRSGSPEAGGEPPDPAPEAPEEAVPEEGL